VIVEEHHYGSPFWGPPFHARYYHRRPRRSGVSWGLSFSN
jgi:hypothetical protein